VKKVMVFLLLLSITFLMSSSGSEKSSLPKFRAFSFGGELLRSHALKNNVFVIFITSNEIYHLDLLSSVYDKYRKTGLEIIAITADSTISALLAQRFPGIWIIRDQENKFVRLFEAQSCCGRHYLYDTRYKLVMTAYNTVNYNDGIKSFLQRLIDHREFNLSMLLPEVEITRSTLFGEIWGRLKAQDKGSYFIYMISDACVACPIAKRIGDLAAVARKESNSLGGIIVFSADFSDIDIVNFERQWKTGIQLLRAAGNLADRWNSLMDDFRREDVNGVLVLLNKDGTIMAKGSDAFSLLGI
jgi:hypothetical protein